MPNPILNRFRLNIKPLSERVNKLQIESDHVSPDADAAPLASALQDQVESVITSVRQARDEGRPVILAFGAHTIKNGLSPVLIELISGGYVTHLATNGAGIIHDWEFAFQGASSEDVQHYVHDGQFGIWEETGRFINLALCVGAYQGLGYGEAIGKMIETGGLDIPGESELIEQIRDQADCNPGDAASAADMLQRVREFDLTAGRLPVPHDWRAYSIQAAAYRLSVPFTGHPMIGHDIIYNHPMNHGAAIGRCAERDYLSFAESVSRLDGGVYLSVGSAVMSPMIFEKAFSMAQNIALQSGSRIEKHSLVVVDLAESDWDWQANGEPPMDNPAYYLRYCKTFSRMGGEMKYLSMDNRDFLLNLLQGLKQ